MSNTNRQTKFVLWMLAAAWSTGALANIVGVGTQNFNSTPDGLGYVTVQSAETLDPGIVNAGIFLNYAINSLPHWNDPNQGLLDFNDTLLSSDLNAAVGITRRWEAGLSAPAILYQTIDQTGSAIGFFSSKGFSEIRLNTKYRVWEHGSWATALVGTVNFDLIRNDPYAGIGAGPTLNLEAVLEKKWWQKLSLAFNFGFRWRHPGTPVNALITPLGDQFIASIGGSYLFTSLDTKLITEIYGSWPASYQNDFASRSSSSAEWIAGIKHDYNTKLSFQAGAGTTLIRGIASPTWRVYTGINYVIGTPFEKTPGLSKKDKDLFVGYITFEFDSDKMEGSFKTTLDELASSLKKEGGFEELHVEGHTDSIGNQAYNMDLSRRRAESIRKYLIEKYGYKPSAIKAEGYGMTRPIDDNASYQGRQKNRRVEFRVVR